VRLGLDSPFPGTPKAPPKLAPEVQALIDSLPRCCNCLRMGVVGVHDRWTLCSACYAPVPCGDEPPLYDLRPALKGLGFDV
jgi:hypothetical protein